VEGVEVAVAGAEAVGEGKGHAPVEVLVADLDALRVVLVEDLVDDRALDGELPARADELFTQEGELELAPLELPAVAEVVRDPGVLEAGVAAGPVEVGLDLVRPVGVHDVAVERELGAAGLEPVAEIVAAGAD